MRVGKKRNIVEAKKTRSCVVRLEKVTQRSPPARVTCANKASRIAMGGTSKTVSHLSDEKKFRGPIKKRPINQQNQQQQQQQQQLSTATTMANVRNKDKMKIVQKVEKVATAAAARAESPPPPTIAAGRSRRAIKPNPKYASEDMVTPKLIRNVGSLASSGLSKNVENVNDKHRKVSTSSSEDFFNRESSDELDMELHEGEDLADDDKAYRADEKDAADDTDFSDVGVEPAPRVPRPRGRPRKIPLVQTPVGTPRTQSSSVASTEVNSSAVKRSSANVSVRSTPTQLQQYRRTLEAASVQRNLNMLGQKRKLDESHESESEGNSATRKQMIISSGGMRYKVPVRDPKESVTVNNKAVLVDKNSPVSGQTLNGSKVSNLQTQSSNVSALEKRKSFIVSKTTSSTSDANRLAVRTTPTRTVQNVTHKTSNAPALSSTRLVTARASISTSKQRSASPATPKQLMSKDTLVTIKKSINESQSTEATQDAKVMGTALGSSESTKSQADSPPSTTDDFETMPTFTIVNVNDIINKKGDVLITKAGSKSASTISASTVQVSSQENTTEDEEDSLTPTITGRNKVTHTGSIRSERQDATDRKSSPMTRSTYSSKKSTLQTPHLLNHKMALRNTRSSATKPASTPPDKPAPRILNSMVAKRTQPVKPMIANLDDSADESFPLSMDEEEDNENDAHEKQQNEREEDVAEDNMEIADNEKCVNAREDNDGVLAPKGTLFMGKRRRQVGTTGTPLTVGNKKTATTVASSAAAKENSLAATNRLLSTGAGKTILQRKLSPEKVVISRQGDKIIKKITCFETWYVINISNEERRIVPVRNQLEMPLIKLANLAKSIALPSDTWSSKVTLYELSAATLAKSALVTYTGDLQEQHIAEEDRAKYQPSCVMFRRAVRDRQKSRLPYDRAVIFKNKTFFTNIEGKNVKLLAAPSSISTSAEIEILLQIVDTLTLQNEFVEQATTVQ